MSAPAHWPVVTPATATSPSSSCRVASSRASAIIASGAGPPNTPECSGCSRVRTVTTQATSPRRAVVSTGSPTVRLPMSHTMKTSHSNSSGWASTKASRLLSVSSIPSRTSLTVHGGLPSKTRRVPEVGHQPALVVGSAPPVDPAVLVGRDPRVGRPALLRRCGLHVVVGVEHDDRGALRALDLAVDRREAGGHVHQPGVGEPGLRNSCEGPLGHLVHRLLGVAGEGDRRDRHQLLEVAR